VLPHDRFGKREGKRKEKRKRRALKLLYSLFVGEEEKGHRD